MQKAPLMLVIFHLQKSVLRLAVSAHVSKAVFGLFSHCNSGDIAIKLELLTSLLVSITFLRRMLRGQRLLKVTEHMQLISAK